MFSPGFTDINLTLTLPSTKPASNQLNSMHFPIYFIAFLIYFIAFLIYSITFTPIPHIISSHSIHIHFKSPNNYTFNACISMSTLPDFLSNVNLPAQCQLYDHFYTLFTPYFQWISLITMSFSFNHPFSPSKPLNCPSQSLSNPSHMTPTYPQLHSQPT